jgi:Rad3-related DNA helicase
MSATIGNKDSFEDNTGIKIGATLPVFYKRVPSTFDFSQSPIYFLPKFKMTRDLIESNMPHMAKLISMIVRSSKHINTRGIIHTGSYKNAMDVYNMVDDDIKNRCIIYTNSKEKEEKIYEYMSKPDSILIGPTLTEGIDLPDDGCRFIIIMKVPFPYLGDELVKAKISLFPKWYNAETSNNIIQGIGRGNRHMYDWCVTYILDGSFKNLYDVTRNQYPFEMQKRIQMVNTQL